MEADKTDSPVVGEEFRVRARAGLAPDVVRRLSVLSGPRATLSVVQTWGLVALCVAAAVYTRHPLVIACAMVGIAAAQHGLAILAHQSAHYRMYKTRWINDAVGRLSALPLGVSMITYRVIHRIHHNHLYSAIDPDLALMAGYPRGGAYLARKLLKDLSGITTVKNYLYFVGRPSRSHTPAQPDTAAPLDDTSPALRAAARRDRWGIVLFHAVLLAVLVATGTWRWYLLLWFAPLVTLLQMLLRLRAVCEHGAVPDTHEPMRAARTTLAPWWIRGIVFPHSMNFHIEHHLYPSVPHYRLPECHRLLTATGALAGAEVVPTFAETMRKIFAPRPAPAT